MHCQASARTSHLASREADIFVASHVGLVVLKYDGGLLEVWKCVGRRTIVEEWWKSDIGEEVKEAEARCSYAITQTQRLYASIAHK